MHTLIKKASSQLLLDLLAVSKEPQDHSADHSLAQPSKRLRTTSLDQCFSHLNMYMNHLGILLKCSF